jgi:hypothetical protein
MDRASSRTWASRFSRQASRRLLVWAWALCCVGFLALGVFEIKGLIWFVLFAFALASDGALFISTHRVADRPTSTLDERQQTVRNRAYRSAYLLVFYGIVLVVGGAMLLYFTGNEVASQWLSHPARHPALISGFGAATLQLVSLLPTAIIAWTERDEPEEFD